MQAWGVLDRLRESGRRCMAAPALSVLEPATKFPACGSHMHATGFRAPRGQRMTITRGRTSN
jgi:hypothetical protein